MDSAWVYTEIEEFERNKDFDHGKLWNLIPISNQILDSRRLIFTILLELGYL